MSSDDERDSEFEYKEEGYELGIPELLFKDTQGNLVNDFKREKPRFCKYYNLYPEHVFKGTIEFLDFSALLLKFVDSSGIPHCGKWGYLSANMFDKTKKTKRELFVRLVQIVFTQNYISNKNTLKIDHSFFRKKKRVLDNFSTLLNHRKIVFFRYTNFIDIRKVSNELSSFCGDLVKDMLMLKREEKERETNVLDEEVEYKPLARNLRLAGVNPLKKNPQTFKLPLEMANKDFIKNNEKEVKEIIDEAFPKASDSDNLIRQWVSKRNQKNIKFNQERGLDRLERVQWNAKIRGSFTLAQTDPDVLSDLYVSSRMESKQATDSYMNEGSRSLLVDENECSVYNKRKIPYVLKRVYPMIPYPLKKELLNRFKEMDLIRKKKKLKSDFKIRVKSFCSNNLYDNLEDYEAETEDLEYWVNRRPDIGFINKKAQSIAPSVIEDISDDELCILLQNYKPRLRMDAGKIKEEYNREILLFERLGMQATEEYKLMDQEEMDDYNLTVNDLNFKWMTDKDRRRRAQKHFSRLQSRMRTGQLIDLKDQDFHVKLNTSLKIFSYLIGNSIHNFDLLSWLQDPYKIKRSSALRRISRDKDYHHIGYLSRIHQAFYIMGLI